MRSPKTFPFILTFCLTCARHLWCFVGLDPWLRHSCLPFWYLFSKSRFASHLSILNLPLASISLLIFSSAILCLFSWPDISLNKSSSWILALLRLFPKVPSLWRFMNVMNSFEAQLPARTLINGRNVEVCPCRPRVLSSTILICCAFFATREGRITVCCGTWFYCITNVTLRRYAFFSPV